MASDGLFVMAVSGIYGYHATKTGPKCSLVWVASCFVIPPSLKCRHMGTWDEIPEHDAESENIMPRMLTHADLHNDSYENESYRVSPEPQNDGNDFQRNDNESHIIEDDIMDDYLSQYANMLSSKDNEEPERYVEETAVHSERGQTHEERRRTFVRRKSCSDANRKGLSLSLSLPQEQTIDDLHVGAKPSSPSKPEKMNLKDVTAIARRMSIPILDKSEDVDHGTKVYGETLVKKSKSIKQFREAFSESSDDYIPHRSPKTTSTSMASSDIDSACDELKVETPGSYKNVLTELRLRTHDYKENRYGDDLNGSDISVPKLTKSLTTSEIERSVGDYKVESPVQYRNVVNELQTRSENKSQDRYRHSSHDRDVWNDPFSPSHDSGSMNSVRRQRTNNEAGNNNYSRSKRLSDSLKNDHFSKTLPRDFNYTQMSGSSSPRSYQDDNHRSAKQKDEAPPVSDFMKKLTNLTAQTRLATRPSLGNIEGYEPSSSSMMRSQSVMNVSSASPVALSPKYERNPLCSSFSSSASSSSDLSALSYHNVVDPCYRCWKTVYSLDKIGPIRKVLFHKQCFRCVTCNTMLSLNTYKQNVNDKSDVQVYCKKHVPSQESPFIGLDSKNLNVLMHHPKLDSVNTNVRGTLEDKRKSQNSLNRSIGRAVSTPRLDLICGPNEHSDSNSTTKVDKNGNISLRELKMDDSPRSVWSRSSFSAAKLDLNVPASGRPGSSLYRTVDAWNYL